ncbi:MAG: phosphatase PAP2 family protein [Alphaproteobacteria bacterium]|nr:phosphatase PAP2 family protein [Alphaproteobacteria bacterium]
MTADTPTGTRHRPNFVTARLQLILLAIVATAAMVDVTWARAFDIDTQAYALLALLSAGLAAGGLYYERVRKDPRLAAMLFGTAFLIGFSAAFSVLNYFLLTIAGHRIDGELAAIDRAIGVDWPALMTFVAHYPLSNFALQLVYISVLPQIAVLVMAIAFFDKASRIYALCIAVAAGAAICIAIWTVAPSFGAFSVYTLPHDVARHLVLALDGPYAQQLIHLLAHGPGRISPQNAQGLIGFPSYHATLALLVAWYARELPYIRWVALALNAVVLIATPIQGGHHVVDVLAGFAVAAAAIAIAGAATRWATKAPREIAPISAPASL